MRAPATAVGSLVKDGYRAMAQTGCQRVLSELGSNWKAPGSLRSPCYLRIDQPTTNANAPRVTSEGRRTERGTSITERKKLSDILLNTPRRGVASIAESLTMTRASEMIEPLQFED